MKESAVEWLHQRIFVNNLSAVFEQAKQMEKEQIVEARINGDMNGICIAKLAKEKAEQYYNETYKNEAQTRS